MGDMYVNGYHESVLKGHSWRTAENSCPHLLPTFLKMAKGGTLNHRCATASYTRTIKTFLTASETPSLSLLDVGCGSGTITTSLASHIPSGTVTALDLSDTALEPARAAASSAGLTNITFEAGSVLALPFPDAVFDVVHASQVMLHLRDRVTAIREMLRVCRPGGVVALRETLVQSWALAPEKPWFGRWREVLCRQIEEGSGGLRTGAELRGLCLEAGAGEGEVRSSASCWCWAEREEREGYGESWAGRTLESDYASFAKGIGVTQQELEEIAEGWREWAREEGAWSAVMHGEALVFKS